MSFCARPASQKFTRHKLLDRPFTEQLLRLVVQLGAGEAVDSTPETPESEIDQAIILVAIEIAMDATLEVFGVASTVTGALPEKIYIAGVFALVVVMSLSNQIQKEGHKPAPDVGLRVISGLLVLRKEEEIVSMFKKAHWQLLELRKRGDHPAAKEWLEGVATLTIGYVIDEKRRKELKEKHLLTVMLKSLVDATE